MKVETRFDDSYDAADPRRYYAAMESVAYSNAAFSVPIFKAVLDEVMRVRSLERARVLDLASGYGVVAALLRHDTTLDEIVARYTSPGLQALDDAEMREADRKWYGQRRRHGWGLHMLGLDIAGNALAYGRAVGVFDEVYAEDLTEAEPSAELRLAVQDCDLIVEAGSIAHLAPTILQRLLGAVDGRKPWIVTAPIRGNDSEAGLAAMAEAGLDVEAVPVRPFPCRRFVTCEEQDRAMRLVRARGHDPEGYESTGSFHGVIYLARPRDEAVTPASAFAEENLS